MHLYFLNGRWWKIGSLIHRNVTLVADTHLQSQGIYGIDFERILAW